jgi:hypothetical protein
MAKGSDDPSLKDAFSALLQETRATVTLPEESADLRQISSVGKEMRWPEVFVKRAGRRDRLGGPFKLTLARLRSSSNE